MHKLHFRTEESDSLCTRVDLTLLGSGRRFLSYFGTGLRAEGVANAIFSKSVDFGKMAA